jgi:hypothetical protein
VGGGVRVVIVVAVIHDFGMPRVCSTSAQNRIVSFGLNELSKGSHRGLEIRETLDALILCCPLFSVEDLRFVLDLYSRVDMSQPSSCPSSVTQAEAEKRERMHKPLSFVSIAHHCPYSMIPVGSSLREVHV